MPCSVSILSPTENGRDREMAHSMLWCICCINQPLKLEWAAFINYGRASPSHPSLLVLTHKSLLRRNKDSGERQRELHYKQMKRESGRIQKGMQWRNEEEYLKVKSVVTHGCVRGGGMLLASLVLKYIYLQAKLV